LDGVSKKQKQKAVEINLRAFDFDYREGDDSDFGKIFLKKKFGSINKNTGSFTDICEKIWLLKNKIYFAEIGGRGDE
jgi:hypothetical protein